MGSISPVYARFVLREILRQGVSGDELLVGTSLSRRELETGGDIAIEDFLAILENGRRLSGNETLGLTIGRHTNIIVLGHLGAAAAIAPTVREGLQVMANYTRLHISYVLLELTSSLHGLSVKFRFQQLAAAAERFHAETTLMLVQNYVETLTGQTLDNARYHLAFPAPDYAEHYAAWLHSPISFNARCSSVDLPIEMLELPSPYYNAEMWHEAMFTLAQRVQKIEDKDKLPYTQYVDTLLSSNEPPLPDLGDAAARLHMSERTLNRRLQREGTSFRRIKGKILAGWARQHLSETDHSVEAIAAQLGYQDTANFRRAFRNSEGCSPSEFRRGASANAMTNQVDGSSPVPITL